MSQTAEDRIRAQYRARKKIHYRVDGSIAALWIHLARQWGRPVREIKRICGYRSHG